MNLPLFLVDAFTDRPFAGNPAAVCVLPEWREAGWLQNVGREMSQSETAFLVRKPDRFDLRWFTPTVEVDLCGHATLASAQVIWSEKLARRDETILFSTRSGVLKADLHGDEIVLDFPSTPEEECLPPPQLPDALGVVPRYVGRTKFDYLVEVESEAALRKIAPDFKLLGALPVRGTIVTSTSSDPRFDFVSRFFAPACGINEDPVTGSAHCCLGEYWKKRLGKDILLGYQASTRGGIVRVRMEGDHAFLGGKAVIVARGELIGG